MPVVHYSDGPRNCSLGGGGGGGGGVTVQIFLKKKFHLVLIGREGDRQVRPTDQISPCTQLKHPPP